MPVLVVQHEPTAPPGQLGDALAGAGIAADVRLATEGDELPSELDGAAGMAVLGGAMGIADEAEFPHLGRVRRLLRQAAERDVPTLAICLGAQLAAVELGGEVGRRPDGFRVGWRPVRLPANDPVTGVLREGDKLFFWHQDYFRSPPGSDELLVPGDAFRCGSIVAVQAHPEADEEVIRTWCDMGNAEGELASAGTTREEVLGSAAECAAAGRRLLDAWCAEVRRASGAG
jgi:GMP synthase-like glutamine amidotransferase